MMNILNKKIEIVDVVEVSGADIRVYLQNEITKIGFPIQKNHNCPVKAIQICIPELLAVDTDTRIAILSTGLEDLNTIFQLSVSDEIALKIRAIGDNWKLVPAVFGNNIGLPSLGEQLAASLPEEKPKNEFKDLLEKMFSTDEQNVWSPEKQGKSNLTCKAWDAEVQARYTHCIGNWFLEGYIEEVSYRIFKTHATVQVFLAMPRKGRPFNESRCDRSFTPSNAGEFIEYMKELCEHQVALKDV